MPRSAVEIRRAAADDVEPLLRLASRARADVDHPVRGNADQQRDRVVNALGRPDVTVFLAWAGEQPVGALTLRFGELLPLTGTETVHVEQLFVDPDWRRRGVAHQLLGAAATTAEHYGVTQLVSTSPAGMRSANRFLARLGFAPFVVQRIVGVAALRRHLAAGAGSGRRRTAVEMVLAQRRREARPATGGGPVILEGRPAAGR